MIVASLLVVIWMGLGVGLGIVGLTKEESKLTGLDYYPPSIVKEFKSSKLYKSSSAVLKNDFIQHHSLVKDFCLKRVRAIKGGKKRNKRCTWEEYYVLIGNEKSLIANFDR